MSSPNESSVTHPEPCECCGGDNITWHAPSPLWNAVIRGGSIVGDDEFGIVCPLCFVQLAEAKGVVTRGGWRLMPEVVDVELETTTPSGRTWDAESWLWVDPPSPGTQRFHIGDIISITDGTLVSPDGMDGIRALLGYMAGEKPNDLGGGYALVAVAKACRGPLAEQHPDIAAIRFPVGITGDDIKAWLDEQVAEHGAWREVAPLRAGAVA